MTFPRLRLAVFMTLVAFGTVEVVGLDATATTDTETTATSLPDGAGSGDVAIGSEFAVATVDRHATAVAMDVFRDGGNAIDAAVAAALTLGVVDCHNSGIGGGCFILIRRADGQLLALDGREMAPQRATRDMYQRDGQAVAELSRTGPLAVAVPGAVAAYDRAIRDHGSHSLASLLLRAAKIADEGFAVGEVLASTIAAHAGELEMFEGSRRALFKEDGTPYRAGEPMRRVDLAATYQAIAEAGRDWFYRGPFARQVGEWMSANGGILSADDFARYESVYRNPVVTSYREWQIVGFPPPSSGGIHVAQILNLLEPFDLASLHQQSEVTWMHVAAEAMKLAFADRAYWLGDADFAKVPVGLIDKSYALRLAERIDLARVTEVAEHGTPAEWAERLFPSRRSPRHTTHVAAADRRGNWVAITATVNTSFGSKVIVPGTGVILNNEMDDFSAQPGAPNAFGLVGAENNAIAPGKRPLSSMSPTIVLRDGEPVLTLGAAGGPKIITQVLCTIVRLLDLDIPLPEAVATARFHHQWSPDTLVVEASMPESFQKGLAALGHRVETASSVARLQAIRRLDDGRMMAVSDPRVPSRAAAE